VSAAVGAAVVALALAGVSAISALIYEVAAWVAASFAAATWPGMPSICLAVLAACPAAASTITVFSAISISQQLARFFSSNHQDFAE